MQATIRRARIPDVPTIQKLVNEFADQGVMLHRPLGEIYDFLRDYLVAEGNGQVVGCCALHIAWEDLAEIKALAVSSSWQRQGLGREMTTQCLAEARELGVATVFALTMVPEFFEPMGFVRQTVDTLPRKVWGECSRCFKFPNCDEIAMVYAVGRRGQDGH